MTLTILRTAAGAPVAPFVIKTLKSVPDVRVVAVDSSPLSCGFYFADKHYVLPVVGSPDFLSAMLQICQQESVDVLFPDLDEELPILAEAKGQFEAIGTYVLTSSPQTIRTCCDKYCTYQFLRGQGLPTPDTYLPPNFTYKSGDQFPLIVKPRSGRGSKNVFRVTQSRELEFFVNYVENPIIQEFVDGMEYTIDTLSDLQGNFLYCSIRERLATNSGISIKGRIVSDHRIHEYAKQIVERLRIIGPGCLQCIENSKGEIKFIEINPRMGGGAVLSLAAGAPVVTDIIKLLCGEEPDALKEYHTDLIMIRYWQEFYVEGDTQRQSA